MTKNIFVGTLIILGLFPLFKLSGVWAAGATNTPTADTGWEITSFVSEIELHDDTSVDVTEMINVDFKNLRKHGIFRLIPVDYKTRSGNNLNIRFRLISVTNGAGQTWPVIQSREGENVKLKIGDSDRTVTGPQTYVIRYTAQRVITQPTDTAEFYWNVTGTGWPVPIRRAAASVQAPDGSILDTICFTGYFGATEQACNYSGGNGEAAFSTQSGLLPNQGLTTATVLGPDKFVFPTRGQLLLMFLQDNWLYTVPLWTLALMLGLYWRWGRDKQYRNIFHETGEVETAPLFEKLNLLAAYAPPKNILPGEAGVLVDEKVHMQDITATVVDLSRRGFINVKELPKKGLFSKADFELTYQEKDENSLLPYEQSLLDMLFGHKRLRRLVHLRKLGEYEDAFGYLQAARRKLYQHLVKSGYFYIDPDSVRKFWLILGGVLAFIGVAFMAFGELFGSIGGWMVAWLGSGGILMLFSRVMPARTAKGRQALMEVVGLREWIRLGAWRERIHEKHNFFEEVLPYTIAFGLTEKFLQAFNDAELRDLTKNLVWYQGQGVFTAGNFTSSFGSFRGSVAHAVGASLPRSASQGGSAFGGGGGFSGGGGGGGGGGSW